MTIACLAWGSLWRRPGNLPVVDDWNTDGPSLPVEFARCSKDGRITLVIMEDGPACPVLWCRLGSGDLPESIEALHEREGRPGRSKIGRWPAAEDQAFLHQAGIVEWARAQNLRGLVWTALPPRWDGRDGVAPTLQEVQDHIASLPPEAKDAAIHYILDAPPQVVTPMRPALEAYVKGLLAGDAE